MYQLRRLLNLASLSMRQLLPNSLEQHLLYQHTLTNLNFNNSSINGRQYRQ